MKLEAKVRRVTGLAKHLLGTIVDGRPVAVEQLPAATTARIEPIEEGGVLLLLFDATAQGAGDEWWATVDEAKRQAKAEFEIEESDWRAVG